ncbi:MAG: type II toxin-antitoxin system PemK/MazF family toxin [Lachnospiraceae bacterium]|nr:type II toxin-antitoxin system PemK/MazF family toxin [Lachnospiraceae bacterium]
MTQYNRWEIWEAVVTFEEGRGSKKRPVLILSQEKCLVLSLKMTSHEPRYKKLEGEYEVMKWQEAGLLKPTVIQCSKLLKLDASQFTGKQYGRLQATDIIGLQALLRYMGIQI